MSVEWKTQKNGTEYILVDVENGKILARISQMKETYYAFYNSVILGEYVSLEFAKKAIENIPFSKKQEPEQTYRI
jgi:hypothetical protein